MIWNSLTQEDRNPDPTKHPYFFYSLAPPKSDIGVGWKITFWHVIIYAYKNI